MKKTDKLRILPLLTGPVAGLLVFFLLPSEYVGGGGDVGVLGFGGRLSGRLTIRQMTRAGLWFNLLGIAIVTAITWLWRLP